MRDIEEEEHALCVSMLCPLQDICAFLKHKEMTMKDRSNRRKSIYTNKIFIANQGKIMGCVKNPNLKMIYLKYL